MTENAASTNTPSKTTLWIGRILTGIPAALLIFSGVGKIAQLEPVLEGFAEFGYPESLIPIIGVVELACTALYLVPQTNVLGAILLTGYLGGATATHARIEDPMFFIPVVIGILVWGGLFLRNPTIRALIPLRKS